MDWRLTEACDLHCAYCTVPNHPDRTGPADVARVLESLRRAGKRLRVHLSGGEPFLHPGFLQLCLALTAEHVISINTNLASDLLDAFCRQVDPSRVAFVNCSLHHGQRGRRWSPRDFVRKFHRLREGGFRPYVTQVLWPPLLDSYDEVFEALRAEGIILRPRQLFSGTYRGRLYPEGYTEGQRARLRQIRERVRELDRQRPVTTGETLHMAADERYLEGRFSFQGLPCDAGRLYVYVSYDGAVRRCRDEPMGLGTLQEGFSLLERPLPCTAACCECWYFGFKYAHGQPRPAGGRPERSEP